MITTDVALPPTDSSTPSPKSPMTVMAPALLLEHLQRDATISRESAERALILYRDAGLHPISALLRLNAVAELPLYRHYAELLQLPLLSHEDADVMAMASSARSAALRLGMSVPWLEGKGLALVERPEGFVAAFRDQVSVDALRLFERKAEDSNTRLSWAVMTASLHEQIYRAERVLQTTEVATDDLRALRELAEEGPTIELVNSLLSQSVTRRASDVHFEPGEFDFVVRLRVDGEMLELSRQPRDRFEAVACRLKILSDLDIAERRLPQDGRINARVNGESFDIRVSVLPGTLGESIVLRLLRQERKAGELKDLGMSAAHAQIFERWGRMPNGLVLVTGPTGSGKTTTLYTALELANDRTRKIITVEDPVEFRIKGITQLQVNADIGFTFASALRSILRHDPDLILVGEIRDDETARIAIQSALTGHLVLSTLHTNSAVGAITRLIDMGLEPFLVAASLRGLMAQRLVRRLCQRCSVPQQEDDPSFSATVARLKLGGSTSLRKAVGCEACSGTGYLGRSAIYDLVELTPELAHCVASGASEAEILRTAGPTAADGLLRSGTDMVAAGETTMSEVIRATAGA